MRATRPPLRPPPRFSRRRTAAAALATAAILSLAVPGPATTVRLFSFEELCDGAPTIVVARCVALATDYDAATGLPFTRSRFAVEEVRPGGARAGTRVMVPGMPAFTANEAVVLFLTAPGDAGFPWVMGLKQGCYTITAHPVTGERMVRQDLAGLTVAASGPGQALTRPAAARPETLAGFRDRILRRVAPARAPEQP